MKMKKSIDILTNKSWGDIEELIIYGAGFYGVMAMYIAKYMGKKVIACMDNDPTKQGELLLDDVMCLPPKFIKDVPILVSLKNEEVCHEIWKQCEKLGYKQFILINFDNIEDKLQKLSDKQYLEMYYAMWFDGRLPDLKEPKTFNEKMQWLKLHDRNPKYTAMVDKYEAKKIVGQLIGKQYVVPTFGVWESSNDIEWDLLPEQFVLKCTHDSGSTIICRNKKDFNISEAKEKLEVFLKKNYYLLGREWVYKDIKPRIIAEAFLDDMINTGENNINVYKIFNFNGIPKIIQVIQNDKQVTETVDYCDVCWNYLDFRQSFPNSQFRLEKPAKLNEMLKLASKLSQEIPFVRTDFYIVKDKIYFSEFTFYSDAGVAKFEPEKWDTILGEWIDISKCREETCE